VFALAAETGYDGVEVIIDRRLETRDPVYLRGLCHEYGLPIVAMHSPFVSEVQGWPSDQLGRLLYTVDLAQELGVPLVVAHLPLRFYPVSYLYPLSYCRFLRRILCPRLEAYVCYVLEGRVNEMETASGVVIAFENMPARRLLGRTIDPYWFNHPDQLVRLPHITLDTTHLGTWKCNPVEEYGRLKGHVVHVHLSNFDGREHRSPLDGHLPLAILLRHLARDGYQGAVCVESTPDDLLKTPDIGKVQKNQDEFRIL